MYFNLQTGRYRSFLKLSIDKSYPTCDPAGAPNDSFLLNALKTLFGISRVLLDLQEYTSSGTKEYLSVQSS